MYVEHSEQERLATLTHTAAEQSDWATRCCPRRVHFLQECSSLHSICDPRSPETSTRGRPAAPQAGRAAWHQASMSLTPYKTATSCLSSIKGKHSSSQVINVKRFLFISKCSSECAYALWLLIPNPIYLHLVCATLGFLPSEKLYECHQIQIWHVIAFYILCDHLKLLLFLMPTAQIFDRWYKFHQLKIRIFSVIPQLWWILIWFQNWNQIRRRYSKPKTVSLILSYVKLGSNQLDCFPNIFN